MIRVDVKPELLRWARERAGLSLADLAPRFDELPRWETAEARPTLKQLQDFAKATYTPVGYLFLPEPPVERLPVPDMRAGRGPKQERPSPNLLDMIHLCQQRQAWYRDFAVSAEEDPRAFVGSAQVGDAVESVATSIRETLGFDVEARRVVGTRQEALRQFITQVDAVGVLTMTSGVVLNNTHRKLDPAEFRGFALVDDLAPPRSMTPRRQTHPATRWKPGATRPRSRSSGPRWRRSTAQGSSRCCSAPSSPGAQTRAADVRGYRSLPPPSLEPSSELEPETVR